MLGKRSIPRAKKVTDPRFDVTDKIVQITVDFVRLLIFARTIDVGALVGENMLQLPSFGLLDMRHVA